MDAIQLLLISLIGYCAGGIASALFARSSQRARLVSGIFGLVASLIGAASAVLALRAETPPQVTFQGLAPFGDIVLKLDSLSAFFIILITLIGAAASLYSIEYLKEYSEERNLGAIGFFGNLFLAAMLVVVTVANALYFLVFWEMMTLLSYFLVIFETEKRESIQAGYLYMLIAHAGAALIMLAFLILFQRAGSFDFNAFRQLPLTAGIKTLIFLLTFVGFGAKAGMVPLHIWLPRAHPAAPSHISALMSGVMIKIAIYGILRVSVDLLGAQEWWWGLIVLGFGVVSTVLGVLYALTERDIKRLLAYSSVENIGIILIGIGVGMAGLALKQAPLAVVGFLAALYHILSHAFFKSLLFLGAGAVIAQTGTKNLNRMGGLAHRMPWTALFFLIGALAVSAIPPLNGFVSEWFTYQALFSAGKISFFPLRMFAPLAGALLALAGAFAVMVYIKAYGSAFAGPARSEPASRAHEPGVWMRVSMACLALGCLGLGLGAPLAAPWVANVAATFSGLAPVTVSNGWQVFPLDPAQAVLSPPLIGILLIGLLIVPFLIVTIFSRTRLRSRQNVEPWSCGYGYSSRMSLTASGFDQPVKTSFRGLYQLRTLVTGPAQMLESAAKPALNWVSRVEPLVENVVTRPTIRLIETAGQWIQALQMGDIRVYCLYIIITLAVLLILLFGRGGL